MSTAKTKIEKNLVLGFLRNKYKKRIRNLKLLKGGETSQAFSFSINEKNYVIRVLNREGNGFDKDKYAYDNFSSKLIPIPKILDIGKFDTYNYAISEKVRGKTFDELSVDTIVSLLPEIAKSLDAIHAIEIDKNKRFGSWDNNGMGEHPSWRTAIKHTFDDKNKNWETEYENSYFKRDFFENMNSSISKLIDFIPESQNLLHGDYGADNTLSDGRKITGIIDWAESMYGDFLYDIAWLLFWRPNIDFEGYFKKHYQKRKTSVKDWNERIVCYTLWLSVGALGFFVESEQKRHLTGQKRELYIF